MKLRDGMRVKCTINGTKINDAKLTCDGGRWYICQDLMDGEYCRDKKGYKYSWFIDDGSKEDLERYGITNLRPISTDIEDIYVGAKVKDKYEKIREVLGNADRAWFLSTYYDYRSYWTGKTIEDLKKEDFSLIPEEEPEEDIIEITIDEVAKLKGVDVSKIRVKKED